MGKVILITKNIFKRMLKKPSSFFLHIFLPIVVSVGIFMLSNLGGSDKISIALVDLDDTVLSHSMTERIEETNAFNINYLPQNQITDQIIDRNFSLGYVIPEGFEETILSGGKPNIEVISIDKSGSTTWIEKITNSHIENLNIIAKASNYRKDEFFKMIDRIKEGAISFESVSVSDESKVKSATERTFGIYMMFLMLTTFIIAFQILDEKRLGTFGRIGMSPVHPKSYTFANIVANLAVIMVQIGGVMLALKLILGTEFFANPLIIYFILVFFALCGISLGVLLVAFSKNASTAGPLMAMIISPSCMLAGCLWPIEFMPEFMRRIAYITPQRWTLDAISIIQKNSNFVEIFPNLIVVLCFTILFFLIAVYRFKNEDRLTS